MQLGNVLHSKVCLELLVYHKSRNHHLGMSMSHLQPLISGTNEEALISFLMVLSSEISFLKDQVYWLSYYSVSAYISNFSAITLADTPCPHNLDSFSTFDFVQ